VVRNFSRLRARQVSTEVKYTTLALPLFAFLGSSYFLVLNLWLIGYTRWFWSYSHRRFHWGISP